MTAGAQKIWNSDPRIGFLAQAKALDLKAPDLKRALDTALATGEVAAIKAAEGALRANRVQRFNNLLDATVAASFMALIAALVLLSGREWFLLLTRRKPTVLKETAPIWLPEYALAERQPIPAAGLLALAFALVKELSGEAHLDRAQQVACCAPSSAPRRCDVRSFLCAVPSHLELIRFVPQGAAETTLGSAPAWPGGEVDSSTRSREKLYLDLLEHRFGRITRCC
jgi:carbon starvation protein